MVFKSIRRGIGGTVDFLTLDNTDFDGLGKRGELKEDPQLSNKKDDNNDQTKKKPEKRHFSHPHGNNILSYPVAISPDESNGSRLLIKCFKYIPPKTTFTHEYSIKAADEDGYMFEGKAHNKGDILQTKNSKGKFVDKQFPTNIQLKNQGAADGYGGSESLYYIELPIPQDVNDQNSVTWGDNSLNILQLAGFAAAQKVAKGEGQEAFNDMRNLIVGGALDGNSGLNDNLRDSIAAGIAGRAIDPQGRNLDTNAALGRATGQVLNSNLELLFDSVNLRSFPFSVTFSPRNSVESRRVKHIIRALKSSMAAKKGRKNNDEAVGGQGGVFLKSPDVFHLRYLHDGKDHPFLNSFKHCALTAMSVNYTNAGTFASYSDGTPVSIQMNMTFKELNPIYHEDYDNFEPNDSLGVGF